MFPLLPGPNHLSHFSEHIYLCVFLPLDLRNLDAYLLKLIAAIF